MGVAVREILALGGRIKPPGTGGATFLDAVAAGVGRVTADDHARVGLGPRAAADNLEKDGIEPPRYDEATAEPLMSTSLPRLGGAAFADVTVLDNNGVGMRLSRRWKSRTLHSDKCDIRQMSNRKSPRKLKPSMWFLV